MVLLSISIRANLCVSACSGGESPTRDYRLVKSPVQVWKPVAAVQALQSEFHTFTTCIVYEGSHQHSYTHCTSHTQLVYVIDTQVC